VSSAFKASQLREKRKGARTNGCYTAKQLFCGGHIRHRKTMRELPGWLIICLAFAPVAHTCDVSHVDSGPLVDPLGHKGKERLWFLVGAGNHSMFFGCP
jgi:hypothetical protein